MVDPYQRLRECNSFDEVDIILDDIGFAADAIDKRLMFLYNFMGIKKLYCSDECGLDEKYIIAKEELSSQAWKE